MNISYISYLGVHQCTWVLTHTHIFCSNLQQINPLTSTHHLSFTSQFAPRTGLSPHHDPCLDGHPTFWVTILYCCEGRVWPTSENIRYLVTTSNGSLAPHKYVEYLQWYGGFLKWGYPEIHVMNSDFPWNEPSSYWVIETRVGHLLWRLTTAGLGIPRLISASKPEISFHLPPTVKSGW